jgi:hypothetical protein
VLLLLLLLLILFWLLDQVLLGVRHLQWLLWQLWSRALVRHRNSLFQPQTEWVSTFYPQIPPKAS